MTRLLILLVTLLVPSIILAAAFDCEKASKKVDTLICTNSELSELDDQLAEAYRHSLHQIKNSSALKVEQRQWLKDVRDQCTFAGCLTNAYRMRIDDLRLNCSSPKNQFESSACSASDKTQLKAAFREVLAAWEPYLTKRRYYPENEQQALVQWHAATAPLFLKLTKGCMTLECERARIARAMEAWTFPKEPYEALLAWVKKEGSRSPLLSSSRWKISDTEAVAVWDASTGKIFRTYSIDPAWLLTVSFDSPGVPPPFFRRRLTYSEAKNLSDMIVNVSQLSSNNVSVAGITEGMRNSVFIHHGGSAKCSDNPLVSNISVSGRFPDPPNTPNRTKTAYFKIVEVVDTERDKPIPSCVFDDPYPEGFYPEGKAVYKSRVVIDDISDWFVRPDGTFWLKLSEDNWYRFRRDMTSEAVEIGSTYIVLSSDEFDSVLSMSKNIVQLDSRLMALVQTRKRSR